MGDNVIVVVCGNVMTDGVLALASVLSMPIWQGNIYLI
jgi:hypothetical protein